MDEKLYKKLKDRREKGTLRSLSSSEGMIDFASNDYLGFSRDKIGDPGSHGRGATGSRLISGNSKYIEEIEQELADFFDAEAGLCFNSGYDANIGIVGSIPQRGDVILYDEFIHASARDGIRLSHAKAYAFKHNDLVDLKRLIQANSDSTVYILIESLYSMHGDFCPLRKIVQLAEKSGAYIILDEAHSAGTIGSKGRGFAHGVDLHSKMLIRLITFGKAYGAHGAVVLSTRPLRDYLINFSRSFIYTTALPNDSYALMRSALHVADFEERRLKLQDNIRYFREKNVGYNVESAANSPIQFVQFNDLHNLQRIESLLRDQNIFAKAIYAPTVPEGSEGLRISLHSYNSKSEIEKLIRCMSQENDTLD